MGFNDVLLKTIDLPVRVEENRLNLKQNKFEGEFVKTKAKNRSRTNKKGSTNSINNFTKTKFENQNRACKRTNRYVKIRSNNQSRTCKKTNRSAKTISKYQNRRRFKNIYHR